MYFNISYAITYDYDSVYSELGIDGFRNARFLRFALYGSPQFVLVVVEIHLPCPLESRANSSNFVLGFPPNGAVCGKRQTMTVTRKPYVVTHPINYSHGSIGYGIQFQILYYMVFFPN